MLDGEDTMTARGKRPGVRSPVLSLDLDRVLFRTDPLYERMLVLVKARPLGLPQLVLAAAFGREALRQALVQHTGDSFRLSACPREPEVVALVEAARRRGSEVEWLSSEAIDVEREEPEFRDLLGEGPTLADGPASAEARAELLHARHPAGFAYVGSDLGDLPVWRRASERYGVNLSEAVRQAAAREQLELIELARRAPLTGALLRSMRPHQWLKNLLVFVPFALSLSHLNGRDLAVAALAFLCLCLLTSGSYLVNDLFDVEADRRHPRKRDRPIASGDLPIPAASGAAAGLILVALLLGSLLGPFFAATLGGYLVITLAYSFHLKRIAMVDVLVIATLFTFRILAGMLLVNDKPSHWLFMFSLFLFLSLAFMKREVEFNVMHRAGRQALQGRGYGMDDRTYVLSCGLSSGMASIVIFSLFITETLDRSPVNYGMPVLLWGVLALLSYWILRMWLLTTRGLMNDDPILFAARDRTSLLLGAASAVLVIAAQVVRF